MSDGHLNCLNENMNSVGPVLYREFIVEAGESLLQHDHVFPHAFFLMEGEFILSVDRLDGEGTQFVPISAPYAAEIKAPWMHGGKAVTRCRVWCVWPHRNKQGELTEAFAGFEGAYE